MDAKEKFTGLAAAYTMGRPAYAEAFLADLYGRFGFSENSVIADIGSGTGKFAKQLMERGSYVYCVEPNKDMRDQCIIELEGYGNKSIVAGDAAHTALQEHSVDFITAAQAFHWFDTERFKRECKRIIRPGGRVFLIWNMRDMNAAVTQDSYEIFQKYCPKFKGFTGGLQADDPRIESFFDGRYEKAEYGHPLRYDRDKFINRSLSGSYSLKRHEPGYEEYIRELQLLFDKYAEHGVVTVPNKTVVYTGRAN